MCSLDVHVHLHGARTAVFAHHVVYFQFYTISINAQGTSASTAQKPIHMKESDVKSRW